MKVLKHLKALLLLPAFIAADINEKLPELNDKALATLNENQIKPLTSNRHRTYYVKLGSTALGKTVAPMLGFGIRLENASYATDFVIDGAFQQTNNDQSSQYEFDNTANFINIPKISIFKFLSPKSSSSLYLGPSLAWSFMSTGEKDTSTILPLSDSVRWKESHFSGLSTGGAIGYEFGRENETLRHMIQLDIQIPTLAATKYGDIPAINGQLSYNIGF